LGDGDRISIEDETSGTFRGAQAYIGSGLSKWFRKRRGYFEQSPGKIIGEPGLISWIFDLHGVAR
jgi:hypothetical protein